MNDARDYDVRSRRHPYDASEKEHAEAGIEAAFNLESILTLLAMMDGNRASEIFGGDGHTLALWLANVAGVCLAFSDEITTRLDKLHSASMGGTDRSARGEGVSNE